MCRYLAYLGRPLPLADLVYKPANSLIHQAIGAMESPTRINADGFGIGWYNPDLDPEPAVFKDITPAWNNANLRSLSGKVASGCIFAHVRAAMQQAPVITRSNCHPFKLGRLLWMHNGDVPGHGRLHRRVTELADDALVARIVGNTDTELAFVLFLTLLGRGASYDYSADDLAFAMRRTIARILRWREEDGDERLLALNFCVTDGRVLVASRMARGEVEVPSLHYCTGSRYVCEEGLCRILDDGPERCVLVASETLSPDSHWKTVEPDQLVVVREDHTVRLEPIAA